MKDQFFYAPSGGQVDDKEAFLALGVAALMMIGLAVSAMLDYTSGPDQVAVAPSIRAPTVAQSGTAALQPATGLGEQEVESSTPSPCATDITTGTPPAAAVTVGDGARVRGAVPAGYVQTGTHPWPARGVDFRRQKLPGGVN